MEINKTSINNLNHQVNQLSSQCDNITQINLAIQIESLIVVIHKFVVYCFVVWFGYALAEKFKNDKEFCKLLIENGAFHIYENLSQELQQDAEIIEKVYDSILNKYNDNENNLKGDVLNEKINTAAVKIFRQYSQKEFRNNLGILRSLDYEQAKSFIEKKFYTILFDIRESNEVIFDSKGTLCIVSKDQQRKYRLDDLNLLLDKCNAFKLEEQKKKLSSWKKQENKLLRFDEREQKLNNWKQQEQMLSDWEEKEQKLSQVLENYHRLPTPLSKKPVISLF